MNGVKSTTRDALPIFWTSTQPGFNDSDRTRRYMKDGELIIERIPQRGHIGTHDEFVVDKRGIRFLTVIRHDGHIVHSVLTNGAADLDDTASYGQYIRAKHRKLGWYGVGECPCALVAARSLSPDTMLHAPNRTSDPCDPGTYSHDKPCPHSKAELAARQSRQAKLMAAKEAAYVDPSKAILEGQNKMIEQQGKLIESLVTRSKPEKKE